MLAPPPPVLFISAISGRIFFISQAEIDITKKCKHRIETITGPGYKYVLERLAEYIQQGII